MSLSMSPSDSPSLTLPLLANLQPLAQVVSQRESNAHSTGSGSRPQSLTRSQSQTLSRSQSQASTQSLSRARSLSRSPSQHSVHFDPQALTHSHRERERDSSECPFSSQSECEAEGVCEGETEFYESDACLSPAQLSQLSQLSDIEGPSPVSRNARQGAYSEEVYSSLGDTEEDEAFLRALSSQTHVHTHKSRTAHTNTQTQARPPLAGSAARRSAVYNTPAAPSPPKERGRERERAPLARSRSRDDASVFTHNTHNTHSAAHMLTEEERTLSSSKRTFSTFRSDRGMRAENAPPSLLPVPAENVPQSVLQRKNSRSSMGSRASSPSSPPSLSHNTHTLAISLSRSSSPQGNISPSRTHTAFGSSVSVSSAASTASVSNSSVHSKASNRTKAMEKYAPKYVLEIDSFMRSRPNFYAPGYVYPVEKLFTQCPPPRALQREIHNVTAFVSFLRTQREHFSVASNRKAVELVSLTPCREDEVRCLGQYHCVNRYCDTRWESDASFAYEYQVCERCNTRVYPWRQERLPADYVPRSSAPVAPVSVSVGGTEGSGKGNNAEDEALSDPDEPPVVTVTHTPSISHTQPLSHAHSVSTSGSMSFSEKDTHAHADSKEKEAVKERETRKRSPSPSSLNAIKLSPRLNAHSQHSQHTPTPTHTHTQPATPSPSHPRTSTRTPSPAAHKGVDSGRNSPSLSPEPAAEGDEHVLSHTQIHAHTHESVGERCESKESITFTLPDVYDKPRSPDRPSDGTDGEEFSHSLKPLTPAAERSSTSERSPITVGIAERSSVTEFVSVSPAGLRPAQLNVERSPSSVDGNALSKPPKSPSTAISVDSTAKDAVCIASEEANTPVRRCDDATPIPLRRPLYFAPTAPVPPVHAPPEPVSTSVSTSVSAPVADAVSVAPSVTATPLSTSCPVHSHSNALSHTLHSIAEEEERDVEDSVCSCGERESDNELDSVSSAEKSLSDSLSAAVSDTAVGPQETETLDSDAHSEAHSETHAAAKRLLKVGSDLFLQERVAVEEALREREKQQTEQTVCESNGDSESVCVSDTHSDTQTDTHSESLFRSRSPSPPPRITHHAATAADVAVSQTVAVSQDSETDESSQPHNALSQDITEDVTQPTTAQNVPTQDTVPLTAGEEKDSNPERTPAVVPVIPESTLPAFLKPSPIVTSHSSLVHSSLFVVGNPLASPRPTHHTPRTPLTQTRTPLTASVSLAPQRLTLSPESETVTEKE